MRFRFLLQETLSFLFLPLFPLSLQFSSTPSTPQGDNLVNSRKEILPDEYFSHLRHFSFSISFFSLDLPRRIFAIFSCMLNIDHGERRKKEERKNRSKKTIRRGSRFPDNPLLIYWDEELGTETISFLEAVSCNQGILKVGLRESCSEHSS